METRIGNLVFTSKFDSGNLARVEKVAKDDDDETSNSNVNYFIGAELKPDSEYNVWTKPDCGGTPAENGNRSWFYFGIRGWTPNRLIKINIMNMNRQGKLYSQGHTPFVRLMPGKPKWERIRDKPNYETVDGQFILSFTYRFPDIRGSTCYFAFCFPWSYTESQEQMAALDDKFAHCVNMTPDSPKDGIYYYRELLCQSLDKLRIDLITITSCHGMTKYLEPRFDRNLFPDKDKPRCRKFQGKRVFLLSSRVHPGETPASYVYNGFLEFILRQNDPRAAKLRRMFVFKLIPMLNPDGVMRGHYRTDQRGMNLNRMYLDPSFSLHPAIYASKSLLVYHHVENRVPREDGGLQDLQVNYPCDAADLLPTLAADVLQVPYSSSEGESTARTHDTGASVGFSVPHNNSVPSETCDASVAAASEAVAQDSGLAPSVTNIKHEEPSPSPWLGTANSSQFIFSDPQQQAVKVEPLNLADLDVSDGSVSDSGCPADSVPSKIHVTSSSSSILSMDKKTDDETEAHCRVDSELRLRLSELNMSEDLPIHQSEDFDSDTERTEHLGNEGSEDEDDPLVMEGLSGTASPHLANARLREIQPSESGIAFYVDLHGHASKRGCFIYGNYFENEEIQVDNMLYPKLIAVNTAHFDFSGCNFSERNMYLKDKRDGLSKEGSGRVAIHKAIGIIHSYTLECNYNTGRMVNPIPPANGDDGRATPPPLAGFPPKYTQAHYEDVGKAVAIAVLDLTDSNPWSRLTLSEHCSVAGVKDWVRRYLRSMRGGPRLPRNPSLRSMNRNGNNGQAARGEQANGQMNSRGSNPRLTSQDNNRAGFNRQNSQNQPAAGRRELGPVREAMRNNSMSNMRSQQRRTSTSNAPGMSGSTSAPKLTAVTSQTQGKANAERVPLPLTTAMVADTKTMRHLSADSTLRLREEDKVQQLKNCNLLAIAKRGGPPSRIPLPTSNSHLGLSAYNTAAPDLPPPSKLAKGNMRQSRSVPAGFSAAREKSKMAFLEPPTSSTLSKTLPTPSLQSLLQGHGPSATSLAHTLPSHTQPQLLQLDSGTSAGQLLQTQFLAAAPPPPPAKPAPLAPPPPPPPHPPPAAAAVLPLQEGESVAADTQGDSSNKRRRRFSNLKRRSIAPSPKQGGARSQGQSKASGASDSDAERNKPRRRKRRSQRRAAEVMDTASLPASDLTPGEGEGTDAEEGMGQGQLGSAVESTALRLTPRRIISTPVRASAQLLLRRTPSTLTVRWEKPQSPSNSPEKQDETEASESARRQIFWVEY